MRYPLVAGQAGPAGAREEVRIVVLAAKHAVTGSRRSAVSDGDPIWAAKITALEAPGWALPRPRMTKLIAQGMGLTLHATAREGWPAPERGPISSTLGGCRGGQRR